MSPRLRLWCWLCLPVVAYGLDPDRTLTQYVHRIWQTQQGLPQASISAILQSHEGYLWLGTQTGMVRFDGVRFSPLENFYPNAPANTWVRDVLEDSKHALWISTNESGLFRLADGKVRRYSQKENFPSDTVPCLISTPGGEVWACTTNGMVQFIGDKPQVYTTEQGLPTNSIWAACVARDGTLWVGGDSTQVGKWNGSTFVSQKLTSVPADSRVRSLTCSESGVWIGTNNGLVQLKGGHERLFTTKDGLPDNWIFCLAEGGDGSIWAGTRNGFSRWRNGEIDSYLPQDGLSQSTVYSILEDREGNLWVGTKHGLNQFLDGRAVPYTTGEGLPSNDTGPVVQDDRGMIWVGTLGDGLARFAGHRFQGLTGLSLPSNTIRALSTDSNGVLWAGTDQGLTRLRDGRVDRSYTTRDGLPSNAVGSLFRDRAGTLWVGTSAGLAALEHERFVQPPPLHNPELGSVLAIAEDRRNRLFFATDRAVYFYADGKLGELTQDGVRLRGVDAFYLDPDGLLWMGMVGGGMRMLEGEKIYTFLTRDGLFDNEIYGITRDNQDRLWMACSKGIYAVPRSELRRFAAGELKKLTSFPYSPTDALRVIESKPGIQPAASFMSDGRVWFSTIRGLIALDPNLVLKLPPLPVVIEEVIVNGESKDPGLVHTLSPAQKNLEFRYTGLSYLLPGRITFKYRLDGYDKDWIEAGVRREAFYTNLPPGQFRFRLTGCNVDGTCNEAAESVAFDRLPYFYQRIWFLPLCAVLVGLAAWLVYQLRIRGLREQFSLILAERNRIARELHDTLIQGFSGITMEMQALAARLRSPEERGTLEDIIHDAGHCLRETRRSVAGLRSPRPGGATSGLSAAIEQTARQMTEAKDIRLKLKLQSGPAILPADVEYNLVRIAQEAVSNSVKHSGARNVEVALNCTPELVSLSVKDDGSGFARDGNGSVQSGHYGLIGMKERASHIGADLQLASEPGRGTTVSVSLPAERVGSNGK